MSIGTRNRAYLIGNVGKEPETHVFASSGDLKASFSLATSESWKNDAGEKQERVQWHNVVVFGAAAKVVKDYVHKGDKVAIEGSIESRDYTDKDGVKRSVTEIVLRPYAGDITLLSPKQG